MFGRWVDIYPIAGLVLHHCLYYFLSRLYIRQSRIFELSQLLIIPRAQTTRVKEFSSTSTPNTSPCTLLPSPPQVDRAIGPAPTKPASRSFLVDLVAGELFGMLVHHLGLSWRCCSSKSKPKRGLSPEGRLHGMVREYTSWG